MIPWDLGIVAMEAAKRDAPDLIMRMHPQRIRDLREAIGKLLMMGIYSDVEPRWWEKVP